ncbi:ribonuclease P protein subunit rpr2 [Agrilus planipennis]|uniref:Ribonuclease P protein subunit rpr2 n=1 Tax=Agrilus planipennis TaxID=224129 RepID=A0A1W4WS43_AGRPL|nr:ribonuclease P protein subunit rpr2 [Agrilus planipennis]
MNKKHIAGKEHMQRINYLYQASNLMIKKNLLSTHYCNLALNVAKKTVQRLDISIKRTICKGCHNLLICGVNAKARIRKKHLQIVCFQCNTGKKYNLKNYQPIWTETLEAQVEQINY